MKALNTYSIASYWDERYACEEGSCEWHLSYPAIQGALLPRFKVLREKSKGLNILVPV